MLRKPAALITLLVAVCGLLASSASGADAAGSATTVVELAHGVPSGPSIPVTMQPVGLSLEYPLMAQDLGTGACPPPALATELQKLGSPPISLAGDSQDLTAPSGALSAPYSSWETAVLYSLPANFWSQLHCLLSASKDPLTVGINLKTGQLAWATQIAAGAQSAATNGLAFSLGNEPDLYDLPNYSALGKPQSPAAAASLYEQLATYLRPAIGSAPLVGPELASAAHWRAELPQIIAALHIQTIGVHAYPLSVCGSPRAATVSGLLSPRVADTPSALAWVVADANSAGVPAILSEANSVSCGGKTGVSDSPASAVWAIRFVLDALKTGLGEVRFHFSGGAYDPFVVRGQEVIDRPLDTAMVALNEWLPVGSSLRSLTTTKGLVATLVSGPTAPVQLILDNERARAQQVVLRSPGSVSIAVFSPAYAGLKTQTLQPSKGRIKLTLAGNSIVAVLSS
ncbi:MAG TPA: hypothetical protein VMB51_16260 [Solirubrobacteraceae bacterium]|nr:hypothetical protein [Solirubrobacteraceae bacterium]